MADRQVRAADSGGKIDGSGLPAAPVSDAKRGYICLKCGYVRRGPMPITIQDESPERPKHCRQSMQVLGHRQAQAAALLSMSERLQWLALGAYIKPGKGRRKWRAILSARNLKDAVRLD